MAAENMERGAKRKWYPIPNRDGSVPDYRRIGAPLTQCLDKPPHVPDSHDSNYKGTPLDRGKGPLD
jgi:hypothetical protein